MRSCLEGHHGEEPEYAKNFLEENLKLLMVAGDQSRRMQSVLQKESLLGQDLREPGVREGV